MASRNPRIVAIGALALLLAGPARQAPAQPAPCLPSSSLTGRWLANDGGYYRVREVGSSVWWVGRDSATAGKTWTHAFQGTRSRDIITGTWVDVRGFGWGTLTVRATDTSKLTRVATNNPAYVPTLWDNHCA